MSSFQHHDQEQEQGAVDFEQSDEVQHMLKSAPYALPLHVDLLKEHRVGVSEIPQGHLLNHYVGDLEVRVSRGAPLPQTRGLEAFQRSPGADAAISEWSAKRNEPLLIHTPLPHTNRGRNPNSRWYIRGILHPHPVRLFLGAFATCIIVWLIPASLAAVALLVMSLEMPDTYDWVSPQLLWVPGAMILISLIYLTSGLRSVCRVCNQKHFMYRSQTKNVRAHHFPGLGYVLPLCMHLMVFRWFRCAHCGTSIRLKK